MENSLREKIINIIETELNIKFTDEVDYQYSLLDPRIGLKPRDLLVIFLGYKVHFILHLMIKIYWKEDLILDNIVAAVQEKVENVV